MYRISVVIPTYNEEKNVARALKNFMRQTLPRDEYEIIVVDGGSTDRTVEIAEKYADKVIMQRSKGVGGARNDGVREAKCEFVATTDIDVLLPPYWLERIIYHLERGAVGVCGPNLPIEASPKACLTYSIFNLGHTIFSKAGVVGMPGNNTAFRKSAFLRIGGYDEEAKLLDDIEMSLRLRSVGKIVFDPKLAVRISMRRFEEMGYTRLALLWLWGDFQLFRGKKLRSVNLRYFRKPE